LVRTVRTVGHTAPSPGLGEKPPPHTRETTISHTQPNRTDANDQLLTIDEVSEMLRVPVGTLRYWRHLGAGPHSFKVGRWVRYRRGDVRAWINAKRRGTAAS
jgi:predicted DNA-binding transcriptional regulator AlpA